MDFEIFDEPEISYTGQLNDKPEGHSVALDEDENLSWSDAALLRSWWDKSEKLSEGKYCLNGSEKTNSELQRVLRDEMQRQRNADPVSIAFLSPESKYMDTRMPISKQAL